MGQGIRTRYYGPTNTKGSRIKASAWAGSIFVPYRSDLSSENNHVRAARILAEQFGWPGDWVGGGAHDANGYFFVNVKSAFDARFSVS